MEVQEKKQGPALAAATAGGGPHATPQALSQTITQSATATAPLASSQPIPGARRPGAAATSVPAEAPVRLSTPDRVLAWADSHRRKLLAVVILLYALGFNGQWRMEPDSALYLTIGRNTVVTPRFSPRGDRLVYVSYIGRKPRVLLYDVASGQERLLIPGDHITFAPRFSPDGRDVVYSMAENGNTDIYVVSASGGPPRRLTATPGADTSPSYSPDGRRIVFESDRSGNQQLYVMDADGSGQRRISFGGGRYASPSWSPAGNLIAFTKIAGPFRIGVMSPSGVGEKILTDGWQDEGPSWAPNGQFVMFHRTPQGAGAARLYAVSIEGGPARMMPTPVGGSDPSWSPLNN